MNEDTELTNTIKMEDGPGYFDMNGYEYFVLLGNKYRADHFAFFSKQKRWPYEVDHINGDRTDNRLSNLHEVSPPSGEAWDGKSYRYASTASTNSSGLLVRRRYCPQGRSSLQHRTFEKVVPKKPSS